MHVLDGHFCSHVRCHRLSHEDAGSSNQRPGGTKGISTLDHANRPLQAFPVARNDRQLVIFHYNLINRRHANLVRREKDTP